MLETKDENVELEKPLCEARTGYTPGEPSGGDNSRVDAFSGAEPRKEVFIHPCQCVYCGTTENVVFGKRKPYLRAKRRTGVLPKHPACKSCLAKFGTWELAPTEDALELRLRSELLRLEQVAQGFTITTELNQIRYLENQIKKLAKYRDVVEQKVVRAIEHVRVCKERLEQFDRRVSGATDQIRGRINACYEFRRKEASAYTSDPIVRQRIIARDDNKCRRCGSDQSLTIDHIKPILHGGGNEDENLQCLCLRCNSEKGAKLES
jgi:5-methylcytosine-specific restriction endonuclease McrA